jgi:hypothetical protein
MSESRDKRRQRVCGLLAKSNQSDPYSRPRQQTKKEQRFCRKQRFVPAIIRRNSLLLHCCGRGCCWPAALFYNSPRAEEGSSLPLSGKPGATLRLRITGPKGMRGPSGVGYASLRTYAGCCHSVGFYARGALRALVYMIVGFIE